MFELSKWVVRPLIVFATIFFWFGLVLIRGDYVGELETPLQTSDSRGG